FCDAIKYIPHPEERSWRKPERVSKDAGCRCSINSHARATSAECQQAAKWPPSFSSKAGISRVQMSVAKEQRAAKGQPAISSFNDGTVPGISASRGRRESARLAPSFGTEESNPRV